MGAFVQMHVTAKQATLKQDIHPCEDAAQQIIDVNTGEVKVAHSGTMLRSAAIGSCVVVAALNFKSKIGAMAHIMLPGSAPEDTTEKTKYAADAIDEMLNIMLDGQSQRGDIHACLVGAANVLKREDDTICNANIKSTMRILSEKNIAVRASALGGTKRKSVFMDIEKGCISYIEGDEKEKTLWQADQP
jgi:chemotaxis protein CheD